MPINRSRPETASGSSSRRHYRCPSRRGPTNIACRIGPPRGAAIARTSANVGKPRGAADLMDAARVEADAVIRRAAQSTVATLFAAQARLRPERIALVDGERTLTYGALAERSRRLAGVLAGRGI